MTLKLEQQQLIYNEIESGLDFILSHFEQPVIFPRKIMTKQLDYQKEVYSTKEALDYFQQSEFLDCRINTYPYLTDYKDVPRYKPDFIFIDIDKNDFKTDRSLKIALSNTLKNIREKLDSNAFPTVLFTGGGYHIYQPVYCPTALENIIEFEEFDKPSVQFLRFAKDCLSKGLADKNNNPSFKSCLLRIPGSINSKYNTKVKIVQKWNGIKPPLPRELLEDFRTYLIQKKIEENKQRQKMLRLKRQHNNSNNHNYTHYYEWIEKLLQTPIEDFRKLVLWRILCPYLINVKRLSNDESFQILREWLDKCNSIRKLDFNPNQKIRELLKCVGNFKPIGIRKLKTEDEYRELYLLLLQK
jgi:hypothetical protein